MLRVNVLGGLAVERDGLRLEGAAAQPRRLALLALLVVAGAKGLGRDKILALLWPDADEERGRKNLAQSVYALRQVMGEDSLVGGPWDLRINPAVVSSDLAEFQSARESGALDRAAASHNGPFLDGFHLPGAAEFERWVDERRTDINHDYAEVLERLARDARVENHPRAGVDWWRKRVALDPHDGRVSASLMRALVAAGDPGAALQHGRAFQSALAEELGLPPNPEVGGMIASVLAGQRAVTAPVTTPPAPVRAVAPEPTTAAPPNVPVSEAVPSLPPVSDVSGYPAAPVRRKLPRWAIAAAVSALAAVGFAVWNFGLRRDPPTLSIGRLTDYRPEPREELRGPLIDLLATALARTPSIRVVSTARMYELLGGNVSDATLPITTWAEVARKAGASQLIDGALYQMPDGRLRLDLRRLDLENGRVLSSARAEAADPFSLADSATSALVADLGFEPPRGSIASLTTTSIAAYRLYEQGLRALYRRDSETALALLKGALQEDSTFAMAALYAAQSTRLWSERVQYMEQANRLAARASERERHLIRARAAVIFSDPALSIYIDSLVTRFPGEVDGYLFAGVARLGTGEFQRALPYLERVIEMDSASVPNPGGECRLCEALQHVSGAYHSMDSIDAAVVMARRTTRLLPQWPNGWATLAEMLSIQGEYAEAEAAGITFDRLSPGVNFATRIRSQNLIRAGRAQEAADLLKEEAAISAGERKLEALWFRTIALREAGKSEEAVAVARQHRNEFTPAGFGLTATSGPMLHAMALETAGRGLEAAALFDSIADQAFSGVNVSHTARTKAWTKTQAATALASVGDTARLAQLADSIQQIGLLSGFGRDRRLHHHVRGLLWAARGRDSLALAELTAGLFGLTTGYTRTNLEAARLHLKLGQPRAAIALLEPALRGSLEASNLYVSRMVIHRLLSQAYSRVGNADRASHHRRMAEARAPTGAAGGAR